MLSCSRVIIKINYPQLFFYSDILNLEDQIFSLEGKYYNTRKIYFKTQSIMNITNTLKNEDIKKFQYIISNFLPRDSSFVALEKKTSPFEKMISFQDQQ